MMTTRIRAWAALACVAAACSNSGGRSGDDGAACVGAKCDDLDGQDDGGPLGKLDLPPPRADLGVVPSATCDAACAVVSSCLGAIEDDCLLQCAIDRDEAADHDAACAEAVDAAFTCVAGLDCDGAAAWQSGAADQPCAAQDQAALAACADTPPPSVCDTFCALASSCTQSDAAGCAASCGDALVAAGEFGQACVDAQSQVFACVGALGDCDAFGAWSAASGEYPCADADAALATACEGGA